MSRKKLLFIINPHSGKAAIKNKLMDIISIFMQANYEVTVYATQVSGEAIHIVQEEQHKYDLLVCSGGDGTLDEVVTGSMKCPERIPIGYIPAGSTNDFANSLRIPKNMLNAAHVAVNGYSFPCDVGEFNDNTFVYIAAFGLFTDVSYETKQDMKNILGHMAYILEGMKRLQTIKSYALKVTYEDQLIEDEFIYGMITNSISVGGFKTITGKHVKFDDGVFEITLIKKPKNPIELNELAAALVMKDISADCICSFRAKEVFIESNEEIAWTLDGEFGGKHKKVAIKNCQKAINIMIPTKN